MQFTLKNKKINIENFANDDDFFMKLIEQLPTELKVVEIGAHHGKFAKPILEKFENALIIEGEDFNFQRLSNTLSMYKNKIQKHVVYKNSENHNWFVAEGSGGNAQEFRCKSLVPICMLQGFFHEDSFHFFKRCPQRDGNRFRRKYGLFADVAGKVVRADNTVSVQDHAAFHNVFQFAHIAGPFIVRHDFQGLGLDSLDRFGVFL